MMKFLNNLIKHAFDANSKSGTSHKYIPEATQIITCQANI